LEFSSCGIMLALKTVSDFEGFWIRDATYWIPAQNLKVSVMPLGTWSTVGGTGTLPTQTQAKSITVGRTRHRPEPHVFTPHWREFQAIGSFGQSHEYFSP
jgi:hypothetical protein